MMLDYKAIRERVDCREVVAAHLGPGRRAGKWVKFRSPWRDDRNPSLIVSASGWKDMGAPDEHGDAIDFVSRYRGVSTREAAELLGGSLDLRPVQKNLQPAQVDASAPPIGWAAAANAALAAAQAAVWSAAGRRILHYLRTERGLSDATIRALGLGYAASWTATGWREDGRVKYLPPGIVLPRYDAAGELCALRVRTLTGSVAAALGQPDATGSGRPLDKYLSMAGSRPAAGMFGARDIAGRDVLIVEGEFDAALAGQELPDIAVITFGSASAGAPRTAVDALRSAARVFICLDADNAGQRAASALESTFTAAGVSAAQIAGPIGHKDICEAWAAGVDLRAWWQSAQRAQAAGERVHRAVPNTWRAAFNRVGQRAAGWTYELLTDAAAVGSLDPLAFTRGDVAAYLEARGLVIGSRNVHLMLRKLADLGLLGELMNGTSPSKEDSLLLGGSAVHQLPAGRREVIYNLRPIGEQRAALLSRLGKELGQDVTLAVLAPITAADLDEYADLPDELAGLNDEVDADALDEPRRQAAGALRRWAVRLASLDSAPLPADIPLDSAFNWRLAAARAMEAANTAILTRRERAELLGCSTRQVKTVMERAGYVGKSTPIVIEASAGSLGLVFAAAKQHRARAVAMVIEGRIQPFSVEELRMYPADTEVKISLQPPVEYRDTGRVRPQERPPVEASAPQVDRPSAPPPVDASAPSPTPPRRNRHGTRLDWLLAQLRMRLAARGWQHDTDRGWLLDTNTGEIVYADDIPGMLAVLTGRQRVDPDPLIAEVWALGARSVRVITAG